METLSKSELDALQLERLKKMVSYVKNNSIFYKEKLKNINANDIKNVKDITNLPFTVKTDLRDTYPWGMLSCKKEDLAEIHVSSGTTGNPTLVGYSKDDIDLWGECMARSMAMSGVKKGDLVQVSYGYGLFTGGFGVHYGAMKLEAPILPASTGNTKKQIHLMKTLSPKVLACTPSFALYLIEEAERSGIKREDFSWKYGIFGAEPWSENMRKEIEKRSGMLALDIYGLSEILGPSIAMECPEKNGLHLWSDVFYPEVVNPDTGEVLPEGSQGELVITTLTKTAQPLIRYRTRDIVTINYEKCKCGRTSPRISKVKGRSDDMLIVKGINVFPSQVEHVLLNVGGVTPNYQIIVDRGLNYLDTLEILVELNEKQFSDQISDLTALEKKLTEEMVAVLSIKPEIKLVNPNSIVRSEGKAVRVIDKRKI